MSVRIIIGDALAELCKLPDESVHCVVTSPPYWGLRDYGVAGQIGLEGDSRDYISALVGVFREARRVLRCDGTLWLNLGDSYSGGGNYRGLNSENTLTAKQSSNRGARGISQALGALGKETGCKAKDLVGIPWLTALALRDDGWWLRQDIIWAKPNPMPESVTDRCTKAHEYLFLLTKSERYYFDQDAIREPIKPWNEGRMSAAVMDGYRSVKNGYTERRPQRAVQYEEIKGANRRSVWTINIDPFPEAHFATFPPALIEPCILSGCPKGGTVLDPFGGAGTTGLVADRLGRSAILIELNPAYAEMAERRINDDAGSLFGMAAGISTDRHSIARPVTPNTDESRSLFDTADAPERERP